VQGVGEDKRVHAAYGQIPIADVGEGSASGGALLCMTNKPMCCDDTPPNRRQGEWFYPNGTKVGIPASGDDFYRNRGTSVVRLNRRNNVMQPTGLYCCEVATISDEDARICIVLSECNEYDLHVVGHSLSKSV
jgi:hypothetical protein